MTYTISSGDTDVTVKSSKASHKTSTPDHSQKETCIEAQALGNVFNSPDIIST